MRQISSTLLGQLALALILALVTITLAQSGGSDSDTRSFEDLYSCLVNAGVSTELILNRNSTPSQYNEVNVQWNIRGGPIYPLAYLLPESASDVQKAVICGKRLGIRVIPKVGGHGFTKNAFGDSNSLIVDLRRMNDVSTDSESMTAIVGGGARQGKFGYEIWEQGNFTTAIGICPSVGTAGFALGGGQGVLVREYGLLSDNIVEMEMVDAEGRLLVVNSEVNPDLFWALRGGGGGNFGIVTKFKFRIYEAPPEVATFILSYDFNSQFRAAFAAYQNYITSNLTTYAVFGIRSNMMIVIRFNELLYEGREGQMDQILAMFPPLPPENVTVFTESYPIFLMTRSMDSYGQYVRPNVNVTEPAHLVLISDGIGEEYYKRKSYFINKILDDEGIEDLFALYQRTLPDLPSWFESYGGKVDDVDQDESAFVHRGNAWYLMNIRYEGPHQDIEWDGWANTFFEESKSIFGHNATYQNYLDDEMDDYLQRYYGSNLDRLIRVKTTFDPDNFFHYPQSIPAAPSVDDGNSGTSKLGLFEGSLFITIILCIFVCRILNLQ